MVISSNILAMNAQRQFGINTDKKKKTTEKLSSGYKINRAADDAAGLTISEKLRRQIRGLDQGARNTQEGISLLQVADGALNEVQDMLHRVNELFVQAANDTNTSEDRKALQQEVQQIKSEIDRISDTTEFNTRKLFSGSKKGNKGTSGAGTVNDPSNPTDPSQSTSPTPGIQYRTEIRTVTKDIYTPSSLSFNLQGEPTTSSAATYTVSANLAEVKVNGESIGWNSITDSNGNAINKIEVVPNTYSFSFKGMQISFEVTETVDSSQIVDAINGLKWNTKETITGGSSYEIQVGRHMGLNEAPKYTISSDSSGFTVKNITSGETFNHSWTDFVHTDNGSSIAADNILPGQYRIESDNGQIGIFLTIKDGNTASLQDISMSNPASVQLEPHVYTHLLKPVTNIDVKSNLSGITPNELASLNSQKAYIRSDDEGLWVTIGDKTLSKRPWSESDEGRTTITYKDDETGFTIDFSIDRSAYLSTVKKALTKINLQYTAYAYGDFSVVHDTSGYSKPESAEYADIINTFTFTQPEGVNSVFNIANGDVAADWGMMSYIRNNPNGISYYKFRDTSVNSHGLPVILYDASNGFVITNESLNRLKQYFSDRTSDGFDEDGINLEFRSNGGSTFKVRLSDSRADIMAGNPYSYEEAIEALGAASRIGVDCSKATYSVSFEDCPLSVLPKASQMDSTYPIVTLVLKNEYDKEVELGSISNIPQYTKHEVITEEEEVLVPIEPEDPDPDPIPDIPVDPDPSEPVEDDEAYQELWIQCSSEVDDGMFLKIQNMNTEILGINSINISTADGARAAIDKVAIATNKISEMRSSLGAQQNRLEHTYRNITNIAENTQAAESRIRDTDMAKEMVELSKQNILEQVGTSMITQANQSNQGVLNLLQ